MSDKAIDFNKKLQFGRGNIVGEMRKQASRTFYLVNIKQGLKDKFDEINDKLDEVEAKLKVQIRNKYKNSKTAPNETAIRDLVNSNQEILDLKAELRKVKSALRKVESRLLALGIKREMMVNVGHFIREESKGKVNSVK